MIRLAKLKDLPRLAHIGYSCTSKKDLYVLTEMFFYPAYWMGRRIIVYSDGDVRGYCVLGLFSNTIGHIFVRQQDRGGGIGRQLIAHAVAMYPGIRLYCRPAMVGYYESLGFAVRYLYMKHEAEK